MHINPSRFLPVGLLILAVGCNDGKAAGVPAGSASLLEFCNSYVRAIARIDARCVGGPEAYWSKHYSDKAICEAMSARVAAGLLVFDPSKAAACISYLEGPVDCSLDRNDFPVACEPALRGTIPAGKACRPVTFTGCVPGTECIYLANSCTGLCRPKGALNGPCGEGDICVAGAQCVHDICMPDAREEESCDQYSGPRCARNLRCVGNKSGASGTCREVEDSSPCSYDENCGFTMYTCTGPKDALACARWKFPGESCTADGEECLPMFYCGADGRCSDALATEGKACGSDGKVGTIKCASGLYCRYDQDYEGTCVRLLSTGDQCSGSEACGFPKGACSRTTSRCVSCD